MKAARRLQTENKIAELRDRLRYTLDRVERSLIRRELMVEIAILDELGGQPDRKRQSRPRSTSWDGALTAVVFIKRA
jgi:hypothetical protein